jgi:hypothetical protein
LAVKYIPVSIAIVLLMQTVWWCFIRNDFRKEKTFYKKNSGIIVLTGTAFTNLIQSNVELTGAVSF